MMIVITVDGLNWKTAKQSMKIIKNNVRAYTNTPEGGNYIANNILTHNCFPKDLNALRDYAKSIWVNPVVLDAVWQKNLEVCKNRDCKSIEGAIV
jgi:hypothetical protein